jgi:hypothetical protein
MTKEPNDCHEDGIVITSTSKVMTDVTTINQVITDGTFVKWMHDTAQHTTERETLFIQWLELCRKYRDAEFAILSSRSCTTTTD